MTLTPPPSSSRPLLPSEEVAELRHLLDDTPALLILPTTVRQSFEQYRLRDLASYIRIGSVPLVLLYVGVVLVGTLLFGQGVSAEDSQLWRWGSIFIGLMVACGLLPVQFAAGRRYYTPLITVIATVILTKLAVMPNLLADADLSACESYLCIITLIIAVLALRLSTIRTAVICAASGMLAVTALLTGFRVTPDWGLMAYYFVCPAAVCLFVAWLQERQEKINFMQSLLLAHEAADREALNRKLDRLAHQDALSGLANRRHFDAVLAQEWERLRRTQRPLALLFMDVDHFKRYNDHYGHGAGDDCLTTIGSAIAASLLRPSDMAARYGGEEFVVLLPDTEMAGAIEVGERLLAAVDALAIPHATAQGTRHVSLSIGVAVRTPASTRDSNTLLDAADRALYAAKQAGRHRVCVEPGADTGSNTGVDANGQDLPIV
ncbi:MAG: diguanylate cyclase [Moraxellaceae bacterium]|nr:diguanylate cyclase [Moraxellaceae bacterium]